MLVAAKQKIKQCHQSAYAKFIVINQLLMLGPLPRLDRIIFESSKFAHQNKPKKKITCNDAEARVLHSLFTQNEVIDERRSDCMARILRAVGDNDDASGWKM